MTGPQRIESDERWWCNCGKWQSRHRLFTECRAWAPQIRRLWRGAGKDCHWEHPRAPSVRWLWKEEAAEAVLEYLEDTQVGCRVPSERAGRDEGSDEEEVPGSDGEEGGPGPSEAFLSFASFLCSSFPSFPFIPFLCLAALRE